DNLVDTATGTIKVKAEFDNKAQALWPGQYVRVRMTLRTLKGATVIPQVAVILRGNERFVYVVAPDDTAQLVPVQVRAGMGEQAVVEGLQPGQQVVVDGKQNLRPGTPVRLQAPVVKPGGIAASAASIAGALSASEAAPGASR
ncbi:efflux RND transporter periplasmic adaptor subunit, partial [Roseateles sp.]|uniref:efflux RND transporter periplasmic adaptor subunit n=1 Tax=Roseateles sp. TaxID=1971397 RepID=UPI002DF98C6D|nr:efflux RND transporter periplasmic adaptor subunit [Roseateles sp.]